ncbi:hypothetical protein ACFYVR_15035 [Rhodococcus sp. NPDC003318]|uniref:hypothetical protein n=1 Tax=Rhodococcus sp. NPDC003318 TaxID=3364503 RepID=UPI0036852A81
MTRPEGTRSDPPASENDPKPVRAWHWPRHLGRLRTSTVVLVVAFVATALLRGYFMNVEEVDEPQQTVVIPVQTTQVPVPRSEPATTVPPTTTTTPAPASSTTAPGGTAGTAQTPTTSPLIVLPPGAVPSGVELPPGVAVETTSPVAPATSAPAATTP